MNKAMGKGAGASWGNNKTNDKGYNARSNKIFDLMMFAFKSNYTRSVTYYPGDFYQKAHSAGHKKEYDRHAGYQKHLFDSVARLLDKLKENNMLESTLIVTMGEFGDHIRGAHWGYNSPWMVINGGKSGEYSNGKIHPGDVHCSTMQKIGNTSVTSYGTKRHSSTNRAGRYIRDLC
jgi:membrane-anchored protein YejM (alkaline phosphatase superfamily)